nr:ATPase F0 subunit 6 [Notomastus sp. GK-2021]
MALDLFSPFDPSMSSFFHFSLPLLWLSFLLGLIIITPVSSFMSASTFKVLMSRLTAIPIQALKSANRNPQIQGESSLLAALFLGLAFINYCGLLPWSFSLSSHLAFTLAAAMPIWLGGLLATFVSPFSRLAHLISTGLPKGLASFIALIEFLGIFIRPITLSLRLAANMMAGHVLLHLTAKLISYSLLTTWLFPLIVLLYIFEIAIALVQTYVFCLLLILYMGEYPHPN